MGTSIIDRQHQPITARQKAVPGTRALLKQAAVRQRAPAGARAAAARAGAVAGAV